MCVCFLPIHSGHQVCWTYQPGSHRRKVTQNFSSTFFMRCVPQFFSREGFSHSFPSSTVKSEFVYLRFNRSPPVGHFWDKVKPACLVSWSYGLYFLFVLWSALTCLFCLNLLFLGTCYQVQHISLLFVYFCTLFWISLWTRKFVSLP